MIEEDYLEACDLEFSYSGGHIRVTKESADRFVKRAYTEPAMESAAEQLRNDLEQQINGPQTPYQSAVERVNANLRFMRWVEKAKIAVYSYMAGRGGESVDANEVVAFAYALGYEYDVIGQAVEELGVKEADIRTYTVPKAAQIKL